MIVPGMAHSEGSRLALTYANARRDPFSFFLTPFRSFDPFSFFLHLKKQGSHGGHGVHGGIITLCSYGE
jgi:hypothetical protein